MPFPVGRSPFPVPLDVPLELDSDAISRHGEDDKKARAYRIGGAVAMRRMCSN